MSAEYNFTDC